MEFSISRRLCQAILHIRLRPSIRPSHDRVPKCRYQARKAFRLSPLKKVHATTKSHAGSPIPKDPKSMTALSCPFSTRRFVIAISPWTQTGVPCQVEARAIFHTVVTRSASILSLRMRMASLVSASYVFRGPRDIIIHWLSPFLFFRRFKNGLAYHIFTPYPKLRLITLTYGGLKKGPTTTIWF